MGRASSGLTPRAAPRSLCTSEPSPPRFRFLLRRVGHSDHERVSVGIGARFPFGVTLTFPRDKLPPHTLLLIQQMKGPYQYLLYTLLYMAAIRTQIYLTPELRSRLDDVMLRDHKSLAQVIREALDAYLTTSEADAQSALDATFGSMPHLTVPSRDEWDRG